MKNRILGLLTATALVGGLASGAIAANVAASDKAFMTKAAQGGMAEVALGQLAQQQGHSNRVRAFGAQMVTDHGKANKELMNLAAKLGVSLPKDLGPHKADFDKLKKLKGEAFDKAYMDGMVKDHEKDVAEFQKEAKSGKTPQVKAWAAKTLPTLEMHLKMARGNAKAEHSEGHEGHEGHDH